MEWQSREYKERKAAEVAAIDLSEYDLVDGDDTRLRDYIRSVAEDPEAHNLYEILAALRFLAFMRRYTFRWDKVRRFVRLYESLKFSGPHGRQRYKLTPLQFFQFASILGFYSWTDMGPAAAGDNNITETRRVIGGRVEELLRLTRRAILFVPRKFSKTTSVSALAVEELLMGESNAQAYTAANSYKQAKICFDEISKVLRPLNPERRYFKVTRETVKWREGNRYGKDSIIECLSGGADTKDGLNASLVIFDEYAQARYTKDHSEGAELLQALESSMGTRREPLTVIITTASRIQDGPFTTELNNAMATLRGEIDNDRLFASLFMPDAFDTPEQYGTSALWHKVNPHIGITVQETFYSNSWDDAQDDAEKMLEFKAKLLNVFTADSVQAWIEAADIQRLQHPITPADFAGGPPTMVSIDLSIKDDLSAVGYTCYTPGTDICFHTMIDFYIPEETLKTHPNRRLYQTWVDGGWLKVCPGAVISEDMIVDDILAANEYLRILQIGYDSYKSQQVVNALASAVAAQGGNPDSILRAVPQTYGAFTSPVESLEMAINQTPAAIEFSDNPIIPYCFANAYLDEDKRTGNKKPLKRKKNLKIDGCIVTLMDLWLFNNYDRPL